MASVSNKSVSCVDNTDHFLSWLRAVNEIPKQDDLAMSWETTSRNRAGGFLKGHLLIVPIHRLHNVRAHIYVMKGKRTCSEFTVNGPFDSQLGQ